MATKIAAVTRAIFVISVLPCIGKAAPWEDGPLPARPRTAEFYSRTWRVFADRGVWGLSDSQDESGGPSPPLFVFRVLGIKDLVSGPRCPGRIRPGRIVSRRAHSGSWRRYRRHCARS